jgi:hypothetical protein
MMLAGYATEPATSGGRTVKTFIPGTVLAMNDSVPDLHRAVLGHSINTVINDATLTE